MEYHGKFGNTFGRIQNIYIMSRIDIFYIACCLETQTVAPTITGFQGIKRSPFMGGFNPRLRAEIFSSAKII